MMRKIGKELIEFWDGSPLAFISLMMTVIGLFLFILSVILQIIGIV